MALYPLADWLVKALEDEGLTVKKVEGWKTRGYGPYTYDPVGVTMFHHTASGKSLGNAPSLHTVTYGRADLPGPLCHILVPRKPHLTVYVVAAGYANHAGEGGPFKIVPANSGNKYTVGVEVENNGIGEAWSNDLLDTCSRVFAAILKHYDRNETWLTGHKEWAPTRKIDPTTSMDEARDDVEAWMEPKPEEEVDDAWLVLMT